MSDPKSTWAERSTLKSLDGSVLAIYEKHDDVWHLEIKNIKIPVDSLDFKALTTFIFYPPAAIAQIATGSTNKIAELQIKH